MIELFIPNIWFAAPVEFKPVPPLVIGKAVVNESDPAEIDELKNAAPVTPKPP